MPTVGFEPAIIVFERSKIVAESVIIKPRKSTKLAFEIIKKNMLRNTRNP
jgi:hypothetical protein